MAHDLYTSCASFILLHALSPPDLQDPRGIDQTVYFACPCPVPCHWACPALLFLPPSETVSFRRYQWHLTHHCIPSGHPRHWHRAGAQNPSDATDCSIPSSPLSPGELGLVAPPCAFCQQSVYSVNELALPGVGNLFHFNEI